VARTIQKGEQAVVSLDKSSSHAVNFDLVHLSGMTSVKYEVYDEMFKVGGPNIMQLEREVEMY
jgi:hypothetical protein